MPILKINLSDPADIKAGLAVLRKLHRHSRGDQRARRANTTAQNPVNLLGPALMEMRRKRVWRFLSRVAVLNVPEYSLPELAAHLGMPTNKVCSLKAILAKPEHRLNLRFFEPTPSGSVDAAGNPRYRMPEQIRQAILASNEAE